MSNPIPTPPPLPPPTVPSQNPLQHPPPPLPAHPTAPSLSQLVNEAPPSSSSSETPSHSPVKPAPMQSQSDDNAHPSEQSQHSQHSQHSQLTDTSKKKKNARSCCLPFSLCPAPHDIKEPATSVWFDVRIILLFRLAATAALLAHLVFFSLRGDFSFRLYSTWNYAGLSLAFFLVLTTSLLHILRDEPSDDHDHDFSPTQGEGMITDVERQPLGREPLPDPKFARALTRIAVPLYFIFVTATLFGTAVYWAAIHPTFAGSISYPLIVLKVFAPAVALLDFLLTLRMRFRFLYVLLYTLYNGIYVVALVIFDKLQGDPVYALFDPSVQSSSQFIIKTASIGGSSIAAALIMYAASYLPGLPSALSSCFTGKSSRQKSKQPDVADDVSKITASDTTSESSGGKSPDAVRRKSSDDKDPLKLTRNEDGRIRMTRSGHKNDRHSLPITATGSISPSASANRFRPSSARLAKSRSTSSVGSDGRRDSYSRSDSDKRSTWELMEQPVAQVEDEYFTMPTASGETDKVKLNRPMPRTESGSSLPGILSRSGSARMPRSESYRLSRPGSFLVRSHSDRSNARKSFTRSHSAASVR